MTAFQQTIFLVMATLCLAGSNALAQTQTLIAQPTVQPAAGPSDPAFRMASVTIGNQSYLIAQESSTTSGENDETIPDHCLVTMLNFFLEVPPSAHKEGTVNGK
jgi:hypothetical protein